MRAVAILEGINTAASRQMLTELVSGSADARLTEEAKAALKRLHQVGVHPIGVILTKIDAYHDLYGYNSYYYQYAAKPSITAKQAAEA